ncbi:LOW QUALITY PROTEIN: G-patch domain and KOW motifs-containing protein-like [Cylas formicarius]|uniref:LOW QUALITY PROTEIN: G-patch domain and KOW motifs-containing protein-like n=1 Tax=Cylas formicarius TaxID=197179 RepID=UPI0029589BBD|nr:LOW QUALITY PROTEIN: G-patch domain and KOW motifs-containing protein-like [Cylas formicarius]
MRIDLHKSTDIERQIHEVCATLSRRLFLLRHLSHCLTPAALRIAYFGLFHSVLSYGIVLWGGVGYTERAFRLQKKAVRVLCGANPIAHCKPIFSDFQLSEKKKKGVSQQEDNGVTSELTEDELAARELVNDAKKRLLQNDSSGDKGLELPLKENRESFEGEAESTLNDYEMIPISEYHGMAMLRGMGWKEGKPIGKNTSKPSATNIPEVRPKGLGLGASKIIQSAVSKNQAVDKDNEKLVIVKGAFAKVVAGIYKGNYCEVQGFDDEAGRAIVKLYPKGEIANINELLLTPISKDDFKKGSRVINNAKYEEYKELSDSRNNGKHRSSGSHNNYGSESDEEYGQHKNKKSSYNKYKEKEKKKKNKCK